MSVGGSVCCEQAMAITVASISGGMLSPRNESTICIPGREKSAFFLLDARQAVDVARERGAPPLREVTPRLVSLNARRLLFDHLLRRGQRFARGHLHVGFDAGPFPVRLRVWIDRPRKRNTDHEMVGDLVSRHRMRAAARG